MIEVPVMVQDCEPMPDGTCGYDTIHTGTHRETNTAGTPVKVNSLVKQLGSHRRFNDGEPAHRFRGDPKGPFVLKSLEYLLDNRKAGDDLI